MRSSKQFYSFLSIVGLFLLCFFITGSSTAFSKYGGQLVLTTTSDPKSFNAILAKETSTTLVTNLIFEGLTTVDPFTLKVKPHLAERWEVSEDGLRWTFYLRNDVEWADGHPFTADDIVFTFNDLIFNPNIPSSAKDVFSINGEPFKVSKVNDYVVAFELPVKFAPFLRGMTQEILPKHKLKKKVEEGNFNFTWGIDTHPDELIGTGAYRLAHYQPGERLLFKRNSNYWKKSNEGEALPFINEIVYLIVQNADVELLKFMEGTLDAYSFRGMDYPLLKPLEKKNNFTIYDLGPATGSNFLILNMNAGVNPNTKKTFVDPVKLKWFQNRDFRRAIAHAIDKDKMVEIVKNGLGYPQYSPMGPGTGFFHNSNVSRYEYNLDKARSVLREAGFVDRNGDGVVEDMEGNKVELNLHTNAGATERVDIAGIIRHDLEQIGIKVNFQSLEFNTLVGKLTANFEWEAIVLGLTGGVEPHFGQNVWVSSGGLHMWNPRQENPATQWEARVDELFSQGVQELDPDKRKIIYDEFQQIISDQLPVLYTVLSAKITAVRNKFGNLKPSNYGGVFHNLEEIYIK